MPNIREELKALRDYNSSREGLQERIARLRSAMEGLTRVMRNSPDSHATPRERNRMLKQLAELDKLERQLACDAIDYERKARAIKERIDTLPPAQQRVLELRYKQGLMWKEVADVMHCTDRNCKYLLSKAIRSLQDFQ